MFCCAERNCWLYEQVEYELNFIMTSLTVAMKIKKLTICYCSLVIVIFVKSKLAGYNTNPIESK